MGFEQLIVNANTSIGEAKLIYMLSKFGIPHIPVIQNANIKAWKNASSSLCSVYFVMLQLIKLSLIHI